MALWPLQQQLAWLYVSLRMALWPLQQQLAWLYVSLRMAVRTLQQQLAWLYYQYLLVTCVYVMEPWERALFNSVLLSAAAMVGYTSYIFLPVHLRLALNFFSGVCGGQAESAVTLMS